MAKKPSPPRRAVQDKLVFEAVNLTDSSDRFTIHTDSEEKAKAILLEKLGYCLHKLDGSFVLFDADTDEPAALVEADSREEALDQVLGVAKWAIMEPTFLVGGTTTLNEDTYEN